MKIFLPTVALFLGAFASSVAQPVSAEAPAPKPPRPTIVVTTEPIEVPRFVFFRNLTVGDQGEDVELLQAFMESKGFLTMPAGVRRGYFGPMLRAALAAWQAARGISPAAGYFGPISRSRANLERLGLEPR